MIVVLFYNKSSVCQPSSVLGPAHSHVCVHLGTLWHYITQGFFSHKIWLIFNYISKTYNILVVFFHHSHASALSYEWCICLCNPIRIKPQVVHTFFVLIHTHYICSIQTHFPLNKKKNSDITCL